jgi:predicted transcriptional regulator
MSSIDLSQLDTLIRYAERLEAESTKSFTEEEVSKIWNLDIYRTRSTLRKLRKAGFVKRTRGGRYKLTLAGAVLVRIYRRVRK